MSYIFPPHKKTGTIRPCFDIALDLSLFLSGELLGKNDPESTSEADR